VRAQFQLRRAMREREAADPEGVRRDRARVREWQRLVSLDPALYDRPRLEPERVAEVLKRTRSSLLTRGLANTLHNLVPVAAAPRTVHVRVAESIAVHEAWRDGTSEATADARAALLAEHRSRLQSALDRLGLEHAPAGAARSWPNLLHRGHDGGSGR